MAGVPAEYREAIALDPLYAEPHYQLGNTLVSRNQVDSGIAEYEEAIRLDPEHSDSYAQLANVLYDRDEFDAAISNWRATNMAIARR